MCQHQPRCPQSRAPDHLAARIVAAHPEQGWNMLLVDARRGQLDAEEFQAALREQFAEFGLELHPETVT